MYTLTVNTFNDFTDIISPDKARKGVIYPLETGIYALVKISERTFTRERGKIRSHLTFSAYIS